MGTIGVTPVSMGMIALLLAVVYLPQGAAFYLFFSRFLELRVSKKKLALILGLFYTLKTVSASWIPAVPAVGIHLAAYSFMTIACFRGSRLQKWFFAVYYTAVTLAIEMLGLHVARIILTAGAEGTRLDADGEWGISLALVLAGILGVALLFLLFKEERSLLLPEGDWTVLSIVPASSLLVIVMNMGGRLDKATPAEMDLSASFAAVCASILAINAAVLFLYQRLTSRLRLEQRNERLEGQISEYRRRLEEERNEARLRHDLRHIAAGMETMLKDARLGKSETLQELYDWVARYRDGGPGLMQTVDTGNAAIDDICNIKIADAGARGVAVTAHLTLPGDLPLSGNEIELAVILGNALDNAVEGVLRLDAERVEREASPVKLDAVCHDGLLIFSVSNASPPVWQGESGLFPSSKRTAGEPGFGLDGIRLGVERLQGTVTFRYEESRFIMTCVLPIAP